MARRLALAFLFLASAVHLLCQSSTPSFGLRVAPHALLPMADSTDLFTIGGGADVSVLAHIQAVPALGPSLDIGADLAPIQVDQGVDDSTLSLLRVGASAALNHLIGSRWSLQAQASGGYYAGSVQGSDTGVVGGFYVGAGAGLSLHLNPRLSIDLRAAYLHHHDLYSGLSAGLGTTVRLSGSGGGPVPSISVPPLRPARLTGGGALRISEARLERVFPVLFKYYDDHAVGSVAISNISSRPVTDVEVSLSLEQYMDSPKSGARIERLEPGQSREAAFYALFNDRVLTVTEGTKVAARVRMDYRMDGRQLKDEATLTLEMYDRNALRWDDDRKIGAFITARDDEVRRFAKNAASLLSSERGDALPVNLHLAVVQLAALKEHGLSYVIDPKSSYKKLSQDESAVDYVQFPRQTL